MDGIINVLKPAGMSSHNVVSFIRRTFNIKKVGHTGTLDPNAAGVLPICVGKATKITQYFLEKNKSYRAELTLGKASDTQDSYGEFINESEKVVSKEEILKVCNSFKGEIEQVPPMFSALKQNGKKLYELAREGKVVERKARKITIHELNVVDIEENKKILFDVSCSKGTYVRTICNDIGEALGTYGYMSFLIRTQVGIFNLDNAYTLEEIEAAAQKGEHEKLIIPMDEPLTWYESIVLPQKCEKKITNGMTVEIENMLKCKNKDEKYKVYLENKFLGMGVVVIRNNKKHVKMEKMLSR